MAFEISGLAFAIALGSACLGWIVYNWGKAFSQPLLFFSKVGDIPQVKSYNIPLILNYGALFSFLLAFIDPHLSLSQKNLRYGTFPPAEGIAIYLLLDQSGSMSKSVETRTPQGVQALLPKIDILKEFTKEFIKGRPNDMIGLVRFARTAQVEDPLTLDHQTILDQLAALQIVQANEEEGTAMGYAIYKTASLIAATRHFSQDLIREGAPAYDIKDALIILVTDGFQSPNPLDKGKRLRNLDLEDAAEYAKEKNVHLYIVNVDPEFASEEFAPNRRVLQKITQMTGGEFYMAGGARSLGDVFEEINRLEKSRFPEAKAGEVHTRQSSLYPLLIAIGMVCLAVSMFWETVIRRRVP